MVCLSNLPQGEEARCLLVAVYASVSFSVALLALLFPDGLLAVSAEHADTVVPNDKKLSAEIADFLISLSSRIIRIQPVETRGSRAYQDFYLVGIVVFRPHR